MPADSGRPLRAGSKVAGYEIVAKLASGGMGTVYAVRRHNGFGFDKLLALKTLHPHFIGETRFVNMFIDEARIAARIDHPNVAATIDVIDHDGTPVIIMEYLRGKTLSELLAREAVIPREVAYSILAQMSEGLAAAHDATGPDGEPLLVVHRDVSPHNVHVGYDGRVKLLDFGIAAARGRVSSTRTGEVKGKLAYVAPEQLMQGTVDRRADLFALGVVAWETIANERLFRQDDEASTLWAVMHKAVPPLSTASREVPKEVDAIVAQCLLRPVEERPASAHEVAKVFARAAGSTGPKEIARVMADVFQRERDAEALLLSSQGRDVSTDSGSVSPFETASAHTHNESTSTSSSGDVALARPPSGRRSRWAKLGLYALALAAGGVLALATILDVGGVREGFRSRKTSALDVSPSVRVNEPTATVSAAPPASEVSLAVDPGVRLVLVDGQRHDERPVIVSIAEDGSAHVSLVGPTGAIEDRLIHLSDSGNTLALSASGAGSSSASATIERAAAPPVHAKMPHASPPQGNGRPTLLKSPY